MTNPFATAPQQAPATISDQAAQQFGAPAQPQQQAAPQGVDWSQVGQGLAQPHAGQQGQPPQTVQAPVGTQPWTPQQHEAYNQMRENGMAAAPQGYAPAAQQLPQAPFPPAAQQQAAPQFGATQTPAQGFGGFIPQQQSAPASGPAYDPSMFGAPSAGGGGTYPKVRDIAGRLCLIRTKKRDAEGTAYGDPTKKIVNYIANVAVLDGGPIHASPNAEDPMAQPELVSETVPYVITDMIISQVGLHNRLKNDFVRGRIMQHPKGALEKQLLERFAGMTAPQALFTALQQGLLNPAQLTSGTYFWTIVPDDSAAADQLVSAFAQHPSARDLML